MLFYPNIFYYATILLVAFFSMLIIGAGCMKLLPELFSENNPIANVFVSLMSGNIVLVTFFALICSRCNTIFILSVLIVAAYLIFLRQKSEKLYSKFVIDKRFCKYSFCSVLLLSLIYLVSYYVFFVRANGEIWCDYTFYSNVSCHISKNHCENANLFSDLHNAERYHWGDLWLTALFGKLFNANYLYILLLITYPFLTLLCVLGGASVVFKLINNRCLSLIYGMGLLFAVPLMTILMPWLSPVLIGSKQILIYCFVLLSLLFYCSERYKLAYMSLLLLVPFYSTVAPGVLTMVCVLSIIEGYKNGEKISHFLFNREVLLSIGITIFYGAFYILQKRSGEQQLTLLYSNSLMNVLGFVVKRSARASVLFPSVIGLIAIKRLYKDFNCFLAYKWLIAAVFGIFVSSVVGGIVKQVMLDGGQITTNFYEPMLIISCWWAFVFILSKFMEGKYVSVGIPMLTSVYILIFVFSEKPAVYVTSNHLYSSQEVDEMAVLKQELIGADYSWGYYRNYGLDENFNTQKSRIRMIYPMDKMPHLIENGYYAPYCLSALNLPDDLEPRWNEISQAELFKYMNKRKDEGTYKDEANLIWDFIVERNVKYIVVEHGCELPQYLVDKVSIVYDGRDKVYRNEMK